MIRDNVYLLREPGIKVNDLCLSYKEVMPIREQVMILGRELNISTCGALKFIVRVLPSTTLPAGFAWFAFPRWELFANTYGVALEKILILLSGKRKFYNYRHEQLGEKYLRLSARTSEMLAVVGAKQKARGRSSEIFIVAAQLGERYQGNSALQVESLLKVNEFALCPFLVASSLITHPERESTWNQLHIGCAGAEFSQEADENFAHIPVFGFHDATPKFNAYWADISDPSIGIGTALT